MGKANFSDEFKRDAVAQITERGYRVAEVSQRLGVSQHNQHVHPVSPVVRWYCYAVALSPPWQLRT